MMARGAPFTASKVRRMMWSRHWVSTWIVTSWPPETEEILRYQWKAAVPVWKALAARARDHGVKRIALEFHGWQLVYNVETLRRLRSEVGDDILGVNLDPSHLFWMGADPVEVARALADCIYHVHIKDVRLEPAAGQNTLLDTNPISNQFEIAAMNIEYDFGLQAEDVVSYKGVKSNDNGDAGLVLVIEAADGKAEDIANQLTAYQQDQVAFYGNYAEFAQAQSNVENAVIAFKDNRVVMAIASNECTVDLDSAVDSALNS